MLGNIVAICLSSHASNLWTCGWETITTGILSSEWSTVPYRTIPLIAARMNTWYNLSPMWTLMQLVTDSGMTGRKITMIVRSTDSVITVLLNMKDCSIWRSQLHIAFDKYAAQTFKWLLENDVGWVVWLLHEYAMQGENPALQWQNEQLKAYVVFRGSLSPSWKKNESKTVFSLFSITPYLFSI